MARLSQSIASDDYYPPSSRSNQALQPTATRWTSTFFMIETVQEISVSLPVAAAELDLVK